MYHRHPKRGSSRLAGGSGRSLRSPAVPLYAALLATEQRARRVIETATDPYVEADAAGRITAWNRRAEEVFGWSREEVVGRHFSEVIVPEDDGRRWRSPADAMARVSSRLAEHGGTATVELGFLSRSGAVAVEVTVWSTDVGGEQRFHGFLRDIRERRAAEKALRHQALHDALTGLPNRWHLLQELWSVGSRDEAALLVVDLDHFKDVNGTLGHDVGDTVLRQVAARLRRCAGERGLVARLDGDEFAVLLRTADPVAVEGVAQRILAAVQQPLLHGDLRFAIGASVGIAYLPAHGSEARGLLAKAGMAMYRAKAEGRGWRTYHRDDERDRRQHLAMLAELRDDVRSGRLHVHYQPQVDLRTGTVSGVEALARWTSSQGDVSPAVFVPLAEQAGVLNEMTDHVLDAALRQVAAWRRRGLGLHVAVNVTARDLQDEAFSQRVAEALAVHGLPGEALVVEITEQTLVEVAPPVLANLFHLRGLGCGVSLDDFGRGYSCLAHLKDLPVTELKIDRAFIAELEAGPHDRAIVDTIVKLGQTLGLEVVAEGVEDASILPLLSRIGCRRAQGYGICRPEPAAELGDDLGASGLPSGLIGPS